MSSSRWFAVHVVMYFSLAGRSATLPVWENIFLVHARGSSDAKRKGERIGRSEQMTSGVTWAGKPAKLLFAGVRKVVACAASTSRSGSADVTVVHSGVEATYSEFRIPKGEFRKFVRGKQARVMFEE